MNSEIRLVPLCKVNEWKLSKELSSYAQGNDKDNSLVYLLFGIDVHIEITMSTVEATMRVGPENSVLEFYFVLDLRTGIVSTADNRSCCGIVEGTDAYEKIQGEYNDWRKNIVNVLDLANMCSEKGVFIPNSAI